jgi:DNA-binding HxlR family transcriptional regulator
VGGTRPDIGGVRADGKQPPGSGCGSAQGAALAWQGIGRRLAPLQKKWDVAVLSNLPDEGWGRPGVILRSINAQDSSGQQITWKVLNETIKRLEASGFIGRVQSMGVPGESRIWLLGPGRRLIAALRLLDAWYRQGEAGDAG